MSYRIRDWATHFENNRTKELKRMAWVPVPNRMDGLGYVTLVTHPNGGAHLGAWLAIVEISSRQTVRGTLPQEGAGIPQALAAISRLPAGLFEEVLPRLLQIGWIEQFGEIPQEGAGIPQDAAPRALAERNGTEGTEGTIDRPPLDEWYRSALAEYPGAKGLSGHPDAAVIEKCITLTKGNTTVMAMALRKMHFAGKAPNHSWMWFPTVLKGYIA